MRVVIDGSGIRAGGGITHLSELLGAVDPEEFSFSTIQVWASKMTLSRLPKGGVIQHAHHPALEQNIALRTLWQRRLLPRSLDPDRDLLFVPGGLSLSPYGCMVSMAQNLLPFDEVEQERFANPRSRLRYQLLRWGQLRTFEQSGGAIFVSEYLQDAVAQHSAQDLPPSRVIHHGLNQRFLSSPKVQKRIDDYSLDKPFTLLYVSVVNVYKHQWNVVEAVAKLRESGSPIALELVGPAQPSSLERLNESISRHDPEGKFVTYRGAIPFEELHKAYQAADGFVFASSCESFGQILLEAMASGLPIASSNMSSLPEVLGDTGLYFDPLKPDSIADAIRTLLVDVELRQTLASAAFERAKTFSWERCARETFGFLREVFDARQGRI